MQPRHVAVLCIVTLAAGIYSLRHVEEEGPTAIAAGAAVGAPPELDRAALPQTPGALADPPTTMAGAVSLTELARDLMAKATTSTTRARSVTTTTKRAAAASASSPTTISGARATDPAPAPVTSPTAPLTPLTTLLEKVTPPVAAVSTAVTRSDSGVASWFGAPDATCAHRTLPMGTMVKVTRIHNGAVATCKVDDRGPTVETGRLIDLSLDTFEKLAPAEVGLIDVRIEW